MSHSLSSTNNRPSWWDSKSSFSENSVPHLMIAEWDYCDGEKKYVKLDGKIVSGEYFED